MNWFLQNGHVVASAWCSPWQFVHLKVCRHSLPFLVSRCGGLILLFALQHHLNSQWFSDLWGLLHFMHFEPWILQEKVKWPHFQQFLHWGMPGFTLAILIIVIYLLTLKYQLIRPLALTPLCVSQMLIHIIAISDFGDTLITFGLEVRVILSKIWFCFMMSSTLFDVMCS